MQHPSRRRGNERAGLLPDTTLARDADNDVRYFVQDWWFAAPLELALTFGAIGERFAWYEARSIALGFRLTGGNLRSHIAWPIHIHDVLNGSAALRFVRWHGTSTVRFSCTRRAHLALSRRCRPSQRSALAGLPALAARATSSASPCGRYC